MSVLLSTGESVVGLTELTVGLVGSIVTGHPGGRTVSLRRLRRLVPISGTEIEKLTSMV